MNQSEIEKLWEIRFQDIAVWSLSLDRRINKTIREYKLILEKYDKS